jgi:Na+-transporting methylmalonyl-CoA/oxaloacetate decarboxylase beta subunit
MIKMQILRITAFTLLHILGALTMYSIYDDQLMSSKALLISMIAAVSFFSLILAIDSSVFMKLSNSRETKIHFKNIRTYSLIVLVSSLVLTIIVEMLY